MTDQPDLAVTPEAHRFFSAIFDDYRDALEQERKSIRGFPELPNAIEYTSAIRTNEYLSKVAREKVLVMLNKYIAYLDDFKEQVDGAIGRMQAHDQAT